jgi:hypothetical protein
MKRFILTAALLASAALSTIAQNTNMPGFRSVSGGAPESFTPLLVAGYNTNFKFSIVSVATTIRTENTNVLYATGAGTNTANGKYVRKGSAFTSGQIFTNVSGQAFACEDHTGFATQDGEQFAAPFYCGPSTNNNETSWYFSPFDWRYGWTNENANLIDAYAGPTPAPTFRFGTNTTYVTNVVLVAQGLFDQLRSRNILVVDGSAGNDQLATNTMCPFKTCAAAKAFASTGFTIHVMPGTYLETNLLKNGVNWAFEPGTIVGYDGQLWESSHPVFTDVGLGAITSNITGDIFRFTCKYPGPNFGVYTTNPATRLNFEFNEVDGNFTTYLAQTIVAADKSCALVAVSNCAAISFKARQIGNRAYGTSASVINSVIDANSFGKIVSVSVLDNGFMWWAGEEHIEFGHMKVKKGERNQAAFWSRGTSLTDATDLYIRGNRLEGMIYTGGTSTNSKIWITVAEHDNDQGATYFPYGYEKVYITNQKLGPATTLFNFAGGGAQKYWVSINKASTPGTAIEFGSGDHTFIGNIDEFEDTSAATNGGPFIHVGQPNTTLRLRGLTAKTGGQAFLKVDQNTTNLTVSGFTIDCSLNGATNPPVHLLGAAGRSGVFLQNCFILSGGTNAIYAANSKFVGFLGVIANKTNHANVVPSPGTNQFTFDNALTR